jgi:hypothetical protein
MKKIKILIALFTFAIIGMVIYSCNKEDLKNPISNSDLQYRDFRGERKIGLYVSNDSRHSIVAKTLSVYFKSKSVRTAFDAFTRAKGENVALLADFLYNKIADDPNLRNCFPESLGQLPSISFCDLVNLYLKDYPGLEISFVKESDNEFPNIIDDDIFETVSVYTDTDIYPSYIGGNQIGTYSVSDAPIDKTILKLQMSDVYEVTNNNNLGQTNSNTKYADLLACPALKEMINNLPFIAKSSKSLNGCILINPLGDMKILKFEDIFTFFNQNCGFPEGFPNVSPPSLEPRSICDRDYLRNADETIRDVRGINGSTIFRSCNTWCSYWDRDCTFQVDVFIPTIAPQPGQYAILGSTMRVFSLNEKGLRNGWNTFREIPITEWLYLEGKHGDEWQYTWTGRHRRRGQTQETTTSIGLSSKIGFKIEGATVELGQSGSISDKIKIAFEDCPLGSDIARYCSTLEEQKHLGDIDFKLDEK